MQIDEPRDPPQPRLRLVGGSRRITDGDFEAAMDFYGNPFTEMRQLVKHTGALTRYVGFRRFLGGQDYLHLPGIADPMVFVHRDPAMRRRTHHVHMAPPGR